MHPLAGVIVAGVVDGGSVTDSWDTSGVEATAAGWLNSGSGGHTPSIGAHLSNCRPLVVPRTATTSSGVLVFEGRRVVAERVTDRRTNHMSHRCSLSPFCFLLLSLDNNGDLQHPTGSCLQEEL